MFSFLKKKLKEGIEKVSRRIRKKEEEKIEEIIEEMEREEPIKESKEEIIEEVEKEKPKKGIIKKIKKKLTEKKLSENDLKDIISDLEISLIEADVALEVAEKICEDLKNNLLGKFVKRKKIKEIVEKSFRKSIMNILKVDSLDLLKEIENKKPFLIVFLGFNGSGKTTSIAKVGYYLQQKGLKCLFAAADCWRAAAIEQLEEHGKKLGIEVIKHKYGADPAAVIFDARKAAEARGYDVILADTAGRSHANVNLMEELKKICRVNKPDLKVLVLDCLTGNDVVEQIKVFNEAVGVDALILSKADVYEKGGAILSATFTLKKPILFLGTGQNYEDMEEFEPEKIVNNLLD
jgi:fused signal recognition particle receptor